MNRSCIILLSFLSLLFLQCKNGESPDDTPKDGTWIGSLVRPGEGGSLVGEFKFIVDGGGTKVTAFRFVIHAGGTSSLNNTPIANNSTFTYRQHHWQIHFICEGRGIV
jgi:hypothetical protein